MSPKGHRPRRDPRACWYDNPPAALLMTFRQRSLRWGHARFDHLSSVSCQTQKTCHVDPRTLEIPFRAGRINVLLLVDQFETITPPTKPRPSKPGWRGGRITTCTSRQHRRHGSIRSSAGSLSLPERGSDAASIPQRSNWKPTSAPSSSAITKSLSRIDGPNPQMKFSRPLNASVTKPNRHYAANFRFR